MQVKRTVCFFVVLLLLSGLTCRGDALSTSTVSIHGVRLTVDLTFPDEAKPSESLWHNATITANASLFLRNLTVVVKAPVNSTWQEVFMGKDERNILMQEDDSFLWSMGPIILPEWTNGKLHCFIYVNTSQSTDYAAFSFYTTLVSEPTFSEMQTLYAEMLANYTALKDAYEAKLNEYDILLDNYSSLLENWTALNNDYDTLSIQYSDKYEEWQELSEDYADLKADYDDLDKDYRFLVADLGDLQSKYESLNFTHNSLQANYTLLEADLDALNNTYYDSLNDYSDLQLEKERLENNDRIIMIIFIAAVATLVAFVVYLKRKKQEPYVVIRKETVSMKPDEESEV